MTIVLRYCIIAIIFGILFNPEISKAIQPENSFLENELKTIAYLDSDPVPVLIGSGYTSGVTLNDFITLGLNAKGQWERIDNDNWIYRFSTIDKLAKTENSYNFLFRKYTNKSEKNQYIVLERMIVNEMEFKPIQIFQFAYSIATKIFPLTEKGKIEITERIEKERRQREILAAEEGRRIKEQLAWEEQRQQEQAERERIKQEEKEKEQKLKSAKSMALEQKKQELFNNIQGIYKIIDGKYESGIMNISMINKQEISITGRRMTGSGTCSIQEKIAKLSQYNENRDEFIFEFNEILDSNNYNAPNNCVLSIKIGKYDDQIAKIQKAKYHLEIDHFDRCLDYCGKGGTFIGRYNKVEQSSAQP